MGDKPLNEYTELELIKAWKDLEVRISQARTALQMVMSEMDKRIVESEKNKRGDKQK